MKIDKPRGTRDFAPDEMDMRLHIEQVISETFMRYGYRMIQTPTFECAELFQLKSGDEIQAHMYVFTDKKGRKLCLRPEATASVCRMFAETLRSLPRPLKLYYFDPMFRYEEPQKGRYREFWQLGVELIGAQGAESDAEVIAMAYEALKNLGLEFQLEIGHLGVLKGFLEDLGISDDKQRKITSCIDKNDVAGLKKLADERLLFELIGMKGSKEVIENASSLMEGHAKSVKALNELKDILSILDLTGVEYAINLGIARGLEYYTGMVFEIRVAGLGAQNQICGGGRYDELIGLFSGMSVPAVGFAYGFDRVMEALDHQGITIPERRLDVVVAAVGAETRAEAMKIASRLRKEFSVYFDLMDRKLGKVLEYAAGINARYVVIVGAKDLECGMVTVRDMASGEQKTLRMEDVADIIRADNKGKK